MVQALPGCSEPPQKRVAPRAGAASCRPLSRAVTGVSLVPTAATAWGGSCLSAVPLENHPPACPTDSQPQAGAQRNSRVATEYPTVVLLHHGLPSSSSLLISF